MNNIKNILGLDLGTTSIGFAHIQEDEAGLQTAIKDIGVRVNPISTEEDRNFSAGKPMTLNADRTLKRGMRRNLDRYQLRRKHLLEALIRHGIITDNTILAEDGPATTHQTYMYRAMAATEQVPLEALVRVLMAINKKRGYKSSRRAKNDEEGQLIDGMAIAKRLYEENTTPGQLCYELLQKGGKRLPEFYRSDLLAELDRVWRFQQTFHPEILTPAFRTAIQGKTQKTTAAAFWLHLGFNTAENKGTKTEKKLQSYKWRSEATNTGLSKEVIAHVISDINGDIAKSSGYLGAISDRSKELFFSSQTIGQYLFSKMQQNPHERVKGKVFYRQDYLDEFERIWERQSKFYPQLTQDLKEEIRDIVIFYQRKLKSQKGLINFCELESKEVSLKKNGRIQTKLIGLKVAPKSSLLFQEFKIWQMLHNLKFVNKDNGEMIIFSEAEYFEMRQHLFNELNVKGNMSAAQVLQLLKLDAKEWLLTNYKNVEGNRTNLSLFEAYFKILEEEGFGEIDWEIFASLKSESGKTIFDLFQFTDKAQSFVASKLKKLNEYSATEIVDIIRSIFNHLSINSEVLFFDAEMDGKSFESQASYQLWHLIYSAEDDIKSYSLEDQLLYGAENIGLKKKLCEKFGFKPNHTRHLASVLFPDDYGGFSTKAIRRIYPFIKENSLTQAKLLAGYIEMDIAPRNTMVLLPRNSLRNPVVEKILNQLANVVNTLIEKNSKKDESGKIIEYFKFDEIRIELSRELKKNAKERAALAESINGANIENERIRSIIRMDFPQVQNPTKNDIVRYKLYQEMAFNGYKDFYTDTEIIYHKIFDKDYDIDHIIPQAKLFDDSFSNKVLVPYSANRDKGQRNNATGYDYMAGLGSDKMEKYLAVVETMYTHGKISKSKYHKLLKKESDLGNGFIERELRETQYIARKAKELLIPLTKTAQRHCLVTTTGQITERLREDWGLINVMRELNLPKYKALGQTEIEERKFGQRVEVIKDWSKRNDHRHHAMDALTVAFTKRSFIQYLNNLHARRDQGADGISNTGNAKSVASKGYKLSTSDVIAIEKKELKRDDEGRMRFKEPMPNFRQVVKAQLERVLVSHKAKNKVVTKNKNKIQTGNGEVIKIELTPRGQLHKETVYGRYCYAVSKEERVGGKFDESTIQLVGNPLYRDKLLQRLKENNLDPKKAFTGKNALSKNPIYLNEDKSTVLPEVLKITWKEYGFSIRKQVTPENFKDLKAIEKVLDKRVKEILTARLEQHNFDSKKAFSDLDKKPIWLNESRGISIKSVKITGVKNAEPLHVKRNHLGEHLLDKNGQCIACSYVSTGNNHHVAIYKDAEGQLQDSIVTLFEAVQLVNAGEPIINKLYNQGLGWQFLFTMKQNEYFVFPNEQMGFNPKELDLLSVENRKLISPNLYRVQKLSRVGYGNSVVREYVFRHHLETTVEEPKELKDTTFKNIKSLAYFENVVKVRLNHLGEIVAVGEY